MVDRLTKTDANKKRILRVEGCFGSSGVPLYQDGRALVGEGTLIKICRKKPKARQFFLFNDILVYGNIVINKKRFNRQHLIPLEQIVLEDVPDQGDIQHAWIIKTPKKSFKVCAATQQEKTEWVSHIRHCCEALTDRKGSNSVKPSQTAAEWIPDAQATICMQCKKTQFNFIQRRHHCRKCGAVVCGSCSTRRLLLKNVSHNPVRICDKCFNKNEQSGPEGAVAAAPATNPEESSDSEEDEDDADTSVDRGDGPDEAQFYHDPSKLNRSRNQS